MESFKKERKNKRLGHKKGRKLKKNMINESWKVKSTKERKKEWKKERKRQSKEKVKKVRNH